MIQNLGSLIIVGITLFAIITVAVKIGVKEALKELKREGFYKK
ncbi:DUF6019 family protein [Brassicibacter mesophilus]